MEGILQQISQNYCTRDVDVYCKDSGHYIKELTKWKDNGLTTNDDYQLVAVDVKSLYPNLQRRLIKLGLSEALELCSDYTINGREKLIDLVIFCLDSTIIQFGYDLYTQENGIATGENNSVSLANIGLHFIIRRVTEIKDHTIIFKRFIDDIIYIKIDNPDNLILKSRLEEEFKNYGLELTFRETSTKETNGEVEFLDVLHKIKRSENKKFIITDFIKPTARNSTFLNGKSYHPNHVFKGIITGEAKRLSKLNEEEDGYQLSLERLRNKCKRSNFKEKIIQETFDKIGNRDKNKDETEKRKKELKEKTGQEKDKNVYWSTCFKSVINFDKKEQDLMKNAKITYARPPTLSGILTNYKAISQDKTKSNTNGSSKRCGRCGLCGHIKGFENMVMDTEHIKTKDGKIFKLKQQLNCKNYGIYVAQCTTCQETYTGQTVTPFSKRWTAHRRTWKKIANKTNNTNKANNKNDGNNNNNNKEKKKNDEQALYQHYENYHPEEIKKIQNQLSKAYKIIFVEKPPTHKLDTAENFWIHKLKSKINIMKAQLPNYK